MKRLLSIAAVALSISAFAKDDGVEPLAPAGHDFFAYANSDWLIATEIPSGKVRWGARDEIDVRTAEQLALVIREAGKPGAPPYARKVADFHAAWRDEAAIERRGLAPIAPMLKSIDDIRDKAALSRWLGAQLRSDVDPINTGVYDSRHVFGFAASPGIHGETNHFAYLTQGGLGLGARDAYFVDSAAKTQYRDHIARVLQELGVAETGRRADAVLALETALARGHATPAESGNDRNADNHWKRGEFASKAPGIDWSVFFASAGLSKREDLVVWQPGAVKATAALVASQPLPAWKDYLRFHAVLRYADVLPRSVGAAPAVANREQRAIDATNRAMPWSVGRLYVAAYFPADAKARVQGVAEEVVAAFRKRVISSQWMTPASKQVALAKLDTVYFGIGYPETWPDDARPAIDANDPAGNVRRLADANYRAALAKLDLPVDRREWSLPPQTVGAVLNFNTNSYNFAAALLQPPKFDYSATRAANYGAIGAILGHELSHFVDTLGADYDAHGAMVHWWSAEDQAGYDAASKSLVEQYGRYRPLAEVAPVDGKRTLVENVADLAGLQAAFDAYRGPLSTEPGDAAALHRLDRQFFVAFAQSWRMVRRESSLKAMLATDGHAPEPFRIATVRNMDAWYEAFDVKPGERMYLEPGARARVW